jgi:hypothetical protein
MDLKPLIPVASVRSQGHLHHPVESGSLPVVLSQKVVGVRQGDEPRVNPVRTSASTALVRRDCAAMDWTVARVFLTR